VFFAVGSAEDVLIAPFAALRLEQLVDMTANFQLPPEYRRHFYFARIQAILPPILVNLVQNTPGKNKLAGFFFMDMLTSLWNAPGSVFFIFALLALIAIGFLLRFVLPALLRLKDLRRATRALERLAANGGRPSPEAIASEVMTSPYLAHLWREYAQTLHHFGLSGASSREEGGWRATAMSEQFFTVTTLVETPLKTEFYKHLPGILTGIGIIGTFAGLIAGLTHFEVSSDTDTVRLSLKHLIQGVGHAFQVSALAITLSMLVTWVEKSLVTLCYRQVARLNERIDSLFEGGVEEEYLARLVAASELSARQGDALRQVLASELRQGLGEVLRQQQEHMASTVANAVSLAVGQALREPLSRMAAALEKAGSSQGETMRHALEPLLEQFAARMETHLGQGQSGLEGSLARTAESLNRVVAELGKTAARMEHIGQGAVTNAAGHLETAGKGVGHAADTFAQASGQLLEASRFLATAAHEAGDVMREQAKNREAMGLMLNAVKEVLENARREAAFTMELAARLEAAGSALGRAELDAKDYLEGVSRVLAEAHASFADNVERTLRQGNSQFHKELSTAVDYLKGAIEALGDTLETLASRK
jgi:ABC-type transporter Mla subunit MlaD/MFS family permease